MVSVLRLLVRWIFRLWAVGVGAAVLVVATGFAFLANAQVIFFPYSVTVGRLSLYSDHPFDESAGRAVLTDVERRLAASPLDVSVQTYRIVVANDEWRRRLVFLWSYGAGGVNYYPIRNVFLRQSDIDVGVMLRGDGSPVPAPRTLGYYGAHEIGHSLIAARVGAIGNQLLPAWVREGLADYIAFGGKVDIDELAERFLAGDPDLEPKLSGTYSRYRMLVAFFLESEGVGLDRLLASRMPLSEADRALREAYRQAE